MATPGQRVPDADPPRIGWPQWRLAWVIVFGAFASGLDASIANLGLETIRVDLHAGLAQVQWISSGYLLALAVSLPSCAWMSRRIGAGRLWLTALAVFTTASGICAAAPDITALIGLRVVQGLAAGLLIPAGQTIIGQAVGTSRLGRVMATLGIVVSLAPAAGPIVGGLILHWLSWRWLFLVNLPVGSIGLLLGLRLVPRGSPGAAPAMDWPGFAAIGSGLPLLVYALARWGSTGTLTTGSVLIPLILGIIGVALFLRHTRGQAHPLLDLRLYRDRIYTAASAAAWSTGLLVFGGGLLYPLYFQALYGDDTITTGLRLLSISGGTLLALPFIGRLTDRYGCGIVTVFGALGTAAAALPFIVLTTSASPILVQVLLVLFGAALMFAAVPPTIAAYKTVSPGRLPDATAQVNILQRIGGSLGTALFAVVLARNLPAGTVHAFRIAFCCQAVAALAVLGCALWLRLALRNPQPEPSTAG
jgi:EmrB/QacA subfamily drug resistance transporter